MSKLEELIQELCPDGVEFNVFGKIVNYEQPSKYIVKNTDYNDEFNIPVLTAGQTFILGYTNEKTGVYNASKESPVIIFDDFTGAFKWVDFPFKVKSSAIKILTADETYATLRYVYHVMKRIAFTSNEHKRLWIRIYSSFKLPLPPLPVQKEIVRILDNFTKLTAELTAELTARKKQYEYYRDNFLNFNDNVSKKSLSDLCMISAGGDIPKESLSKEKDNFHNIPVISNGVGENAIYGYTTTYKINVPAVTIAARGTIGYATYRDYPYFPIVRLLSLVPIDKMELDTKYLYYCLEDKKYRIPQGEIPQLTVPTLKKVTIPLPPLEEQQRIVDILDRFDKLCNDISEGLPAEIEARQKQYEYYRDKLLTFKALEEEK